MVMGQRVDKESGVVDKEDSKHGGKEEAASVISPEQSTEKSRKDDTNAKGNETVVVVLPANHGIGSEITDVNLTTLVIILLEDHPSDVSPPEAIVNGIGIFVSVIVTMMGTVIARPPFAGAFEGCTSAENKDESNDPSGGIASMRPKTMISCGDAETGQKIENHGSNSGGEGEGSGGNTIEC